MLEKLRSHFMQHPERSGHQHRWLLYEYYLSHSRSMNLLPVRTRYIHLARRLIKEVFQCFPDAFTNNEVGCGVHVIKQAQVIAFNNFNVRIRCSNSILGR
jgi:hypothetical protein